MGPHWDAYKCLQVHVIHTLLSRLLYVCLCNSADVVAAECRPYGSRW
jgi:hypothetical protein